MRRNGYDAATKSSGPASAQPSSKLSSTFTREVEYKGRVRRQQPLLELVLMGLAVPLVGALACGGTEAPLAATPPRPPPAAPTAEGSSALALPVAPKASPRGSAAPQYSAAPAPRPQLPADAGPSKDVAPLPQSGRVALRQAMLQQQWTTAATLLRQRTASDSTDAVLLLLARAEVAEHLERYDEAFELYKQLSEQPAFLGLNAELERTVRERRRSVQLLSSSYRGLTEEMKRSRDVGELLDFAERLFEDGDAKAAGTAILRAQKLHQSRPERTRLLWLRSLWGLSQGHPFRAYVDWRWLALAAPLSQQALPAELLLEERFPAHRLDAKQRHQRARQFAEAGMTRLLERELEKLRALKTFRLSPVEELHLLGMAAYRSRQFATAAHWLSRPLPGGTVRPERDAFYAGRAFTRSQQPQQAIEVFRELSARRHKTSLTAGALFRLAREYARLGQWKTAVSHFDRYLKAYPGREDHVAARRERGVSLYQLGEYAKAAHAFLELKIRNPGTRDSRLYAVLEALARLKTTEPSLGTAGLKLASTNNPLGFNAWAARQHLDLEPPMPSADPPPTLGTLPELAFELEQLGLAELAEDVVLQTGNSWWSQYGEKSAEVACRTSRHLTHGRARFLFGMDEAARSAFFNSPERAPRWLWECIYPRPQRSRVSSAALEFGVPEALIYAVMRQESGFRVTVRSPAKAVGLMQIIPPTARQIAGELGVPFEETMLLNPFVNIRFGAYYLKRLMDRLDNNPALVAAAYNAGPDAAERWSRSTGPLPLEMLIAMIPYAETRSYVQRVLANLITYQALYPDKQSALLVPLQLPARDDESAPQQEASETLTEPNASAPPDPG
jgi:soluble lytic murein transglycosylase